MREVGDGLDTTPIGVEGAKSALEFTKQLTRRNS